jgi:hypothetical protein
MWRSAVALFLLFVLSPASNAASSKGSYGINSGLENDSIAAKVEQLGVAWVRLTINWFHVERSPGKYDWSGPDGIIARAEARGLNVYVTLNGTPRWANGGKAEKYPPRSAKAWSRFVRATVAHYKNVRAVKAYGLWNEPNVKKFWTGTSDEYVRKILIPGYKAVKAVKPSILVGAPEISHHWILQQEWNLGELMTSYGRYVDVVATHYYMDAPVDFATYLDKLLKPNRRGKSVWITEIGERACSRVLCSADVQSHTYLNFLRIQRTRSTWFKKIFPYRIWDPRDQCNLDGNGFGLSYGLLFHDRAAFKTYRDFIHRQKFRDPLPRCH